MFNGFYKKKQKRSCQTIGPCVNLALEGPGYIPMQIHVLKPGGSFNVTV